jgi:hypothetical protein
MKRILEKIIVYEDIKEFVILEKENIYTERILSFFTTDIVVFKAKVKVEKINNYLVVRLGNKLHLIDTTKHNIKLEGYDLVFYFRVKDGVIDKVSFSEDIITETIQEVNDLFMEYK